MTRETLDPVLALCACEALEPVLAFCAYTPGLMTRETPGSKPLTLCLHSLHARPDIGSHDL